MWFPRFQPFHVQCYVFPGPILSTHTHMGTHRGKPLFSLLRPSQDDTNTNVEPQDGAKIAPRDPKTAQDLPKIAPRRPETAPRCPKTSPGGPKIAPRDPQDPPRRPQEAPRPSQEASRSLQEARKTLPRGSKRDPRPPETPQSDLRNAPRWSQ